MAILMTFQELYSLPFKVFLTYMHIHSLTAAGFVPVQFHNLAGPFETLRAVLCDYLFK